MAKTKLGLKENLRQFSLLVLVNAFVGGMIGLERSILPEIGELEFGLAAKTTLLSFIVVFGISKAITNYFTGVLAKNYGSRKLLIAGWVFAIPIPFILMHAQHWNWIIFANLLLGVNQGLAWSSTVIMKINLVGQKNRGFAMGLNEFAGYIAVAIVAFVSSWIASEQGLRPYPFYIGIALIFLGLVFSVLFIKETSQHIKLEAQESNKKRLKNIFKETSWTNNNLGAVSQGGLVNNLNDGMIWGLFPLLLASKDFSIIQIGIITAVYPGVWGLGQLFTGKMADIYSKRLLLFIGMLIQSVALFSFCLANTISSYIFLSALLGWGTAMVYPTFLASIAEHTHPTDRAESIGIYRLWRDLGYAIGAILTGVIADLVSINSSITFIAFLTLCSSIIIRFKMDK